MLKSFSKSSRLNFIRSSLNTLGFAVEQTDCISESISERMSSFKYDLLSEFHKTLQAAFGSPRAKYFTTSAYWRPMTLTFVAEGYLTLT